MVIALNQAIGGDAGQIMKKHRDKG